MARPKNDKMKWFKHYTCETSTAEDLQELMTIYGAEGYAVYYITLEYIYGTHDNKLDEIFLKRISRRSFVPINKVKQIYRTCAKIGLFDSLSFRKDKVLINEGIEEEVDNYFNKLERDRKRKEKKKGVSKNEDENETFELQENAYKSFTIL